MKRLLNGQFTPTLGDFKTIEARNKQIYADYKNHERLGQSMLWMVNKYQMTTQRIYQIIRAIDKRTK